MMTSDEKLKFVLRKLVASGEIATTDAPASVVAVVARQHNEYGKKSQAAVRAAVANALAEIAAPSLNDSLRTAYHKPPQKRQRSRQQKREAAKEDEEAEDDDALGGAASLAADRARRTKLPAERLADVVGAAEASRLAFEAAVEPMLHRDKYARLGVEGPRAVLVHGPTGCGKTLLAKAVCGEVGDGVAYFEASGAELASCADVDGETRKLFALALAAAPAMLLLDDVDALFSSSGTASSRRVASTLCACLDGLSSSSDGGKSDDEGAPPPRRPRVGVVATASTADAIDSRLRRFGRFEREVGVGAPNRESRLAVLQRKLHHLPKSDDLDLAKAAKATPGWVGADLAALVAEAGACAVRRSVQHQDDDDLRICQRDLEEALARVKPSFARSGFAPSPGVAWTDVGALGDAREALATSILAPIADPQRFAALGVPLPAGILLHGPPGCGKTLLAKAVASESSANFISVKGPELLDKFVGESERQVRALFARARASAPCIVFFDEVDALCPRRGGGVGSAGSTSQHANNAVTDRVVNQLLTELDGLDARGQVYVVAATNRPELLDPALTRPGRVDKLLFVPLPSRDDRAAILRALTAGKVRLDGDVDLDALAVDARADGFSGADLAALVREAGLAALHEGLSELHAHHFHAALDRLLPSVAPSDARNHSAAAKRTSTSSVKRQRQQQER